MKILSIKIPGGHPRRLTSKRRLHASGLVRMADMEFHGAPSGLTVKCRDDKAGRDYVIEFDALETARLSSKVEELVAPAPADRPLQATNDTD